MLNRMHNIPFDDSHRGTLATIILSIFGYMDINAASQLVFMLATLTTGTLTSIYTYKKIKNINNEKDIDKH